MSVPPRVSHSVCNFGVSHTGWAPSTRRRLWTVNPRNDQPLPVSTHLGPSARTVCRPVLPPTSLSPVGSDTGNEGVLRSRGSVHRRTGLRHRVHWDHRHSYVLLETLVPEPPFDQSGDFSVRRGVRVPTVLSPSQRGLRCPASTTVLRRTSVETFRPLVIGRVQVVVRLSGPHRSCQWRHATSKRGLCLLCVYEGYTNIVLKKRVVRKSLSKVDKTFQLP